MFTGPRNGRSFIKVQGVQQGERADTAGTGEEGTGLGARTDTGYERFHARPVSAT